jgi:hypothetical protein
VTVGRGVHDWVTKEGRKTREKICDIKGRREKNNQIIHKREITTKQIKTTLTKEW